MEKKGLTDVWQSSLMHGTFKGTQFYPANNVLNLKTETGGSLLLTLPFPITLFSDAHCSARQFHINVRVFSTGTEYVRLFHRKLVPLSIGSYLLLLWKRKIIHVHIHVQKCTLVEALREIKREKIWEHLIKKQKCQLYKVKYAIERKMAYFRILTGMESSFSLVACWSVRKMSRNALEFD